MRLPNHARLPIMAQSPCTVAVRKNGEPPARADEAAAYIPLFEVTSRRHAVLTVDQDADRWVISKTKGVQQLWAAAEKILQGIE